MGSGNYSKGNFAISQWFVGTGWNTTDGWQGGAEADFAEVFTYNRVLTVELDQKVQSYMALQIRYSHETKLCIERWYAGMGCSGQCCL